MRSEHLTQKGGEILKVSPLWTAGELGELIGKEGKHYGPRSVNCKLIPTILIIIHFQQKFPRGRWGTLSPVQEVPPMCTDLSLPDLPGDGKKRSLKVQ